MVKPSPRYDERDFGPFHSVDTVTSWSDIIHCASVTVSTLEITFQARHGHEQMNVVQAQNIVPDPEWAVSVSKVAVKLYEHLVHLWVLLLYNIIKTR
jgi:hypothetical protein